MIQDLPIKTPDLFGKKFGVLTVKEFVRVGRDKKRRHYWLCECECGNLKKFSTWKLLYRNHVCQCNYKNPGQSDYSTYKIWQLMKARCKQNHPNRKSYCDKGITVCARWLSYETFLADMGERPKGMQIDRIDNSRGYEPGNCRWTTSEVQNNNKDNNTRLPYRGEIHTIAEWGRILGIKRNTLVARIRYWGICEKVFSRETRRWVRKMA